MLPTLRPDGSQAISPTAHYTGYVWARNGRSRPELATLEASTGWVNRSVVQTQNR